MKYASTSKQIHFLEQHYWEALKENDVDKAVKLTRFPCTIVSQAGVRKIQEDEYRKNMKKMDRSFFKGVEIENEVIDVLSEDVAIITYQLRFDNKEMQDVSTWIKTDGNWKCAMHSETPVKS